MSAKKKNPKQVLAEIKMGTPFVRKKVSIEWNQWEERYGLIIHEKVGDKLESSLISNEKALQVITDNLNEETATDHKMRITVAATAIVVSIAIGFIWSAQFFGWPQGKVNATAIVFLIAVMVQFILIFIKRR